MGVVKNLIKYRTAIILALSAILLVIILIPALGEYNVSKEFFQQFESEKIVHSNGNLGITNAGTTIKTVKDLLGLESHIDISDLDPNNPEDEIDRARISMSEIDKGFGWGIFLIYLAIILLVISVMYTYVKPKAILGMVGFLAVPVCVWYANVIVQRTFILMNNSLADIMEYFGYEATKDPFSIKFSPILYIVIGLGVLLFLANILLRNHKTTENETENLTRYITFTCAAIAIIVVGLVTIFLFAEGLPPIGKIGLSEFFSTTWDPVPNDSSIAPQFGISYLILTSLLGTIGAIIIGVPIGILTAAFIAKMAPPWIATILRSAVNLLAGIPSVIYGAVGLAVLVPFVQRLGGAITGQPDGLLPTGNTMFSAIIVLAIMILPTIIGITEASIRAVPETFLEASLALGITKESSIFKILLPAARSGVMTGTLLGLGRAIGEAMAITLVAGNVVQFPEMFKPVRFLTVGIVQEMGYASGLHREALISIGLILFVFILVINGVFRTVINKAAKKYG